MTIDDLHRAIARRTNGARVEVHAHPGYFVVTCPDRIGADEQCDRVVGARGATVLEALTALLRVL